MGLTSQQQSYSLMVDNNAAVFLESTKEMQVSGAPAHDCCAQHMHSTYTAQHSVAHAQHMHSTCTTHAQHSIAQHRTAPHSA